MACDESPRLAFLLYFFLSSAASAEAFKATLLPQRWTAVQLGETLVLSCSATGCGSGTPISFVWRGLGDTSLGGKVSQLEGQSNLTISPVRLENAQRHVCLASCGPSKRQVTTDVDVYSFPSDPVISSTPLVAGSPAEITCELADVFPSHRFTLTLMKNAQRLAHRAFDDGHPDDEEKRTTTLSLKHKFTPSSQDEGTSYLCLSEMIFDNEEAEREPMKRQSSMILRVSYSPQNVTIALDPSNMLREGDPLNLTCTAQSKPPAKITWIKQSGKDLQTLQESHSLILESVELSDSGVYICEAHNSVGRDASRTEIIVQVPPRNTNISVFPNDLVKEGDNVTISCLSLGVPAPRITLRMKEGSGVTVLVSKKGSHTIHRARKEDAGTYECESANELGTQLATATLVVQVPPQSTTAAVLPSENTPERHHTRVTSPSLVLTEMAPEDETVNASRSVDVLIHSDTNNEGTDIRKEVINKTQNVEILLSEEEDPLKDVVVGIAVLTCIALLSLVAITAAIYFAKQAKTQGSYSLVNAKTATV